MTDSAAPATANATDDEHFVDLYAVLGVDPRTPPAELRRRIAVLYTEAQANLDHRRFRKRFYYHELYEVHLPHAHHVLLDDGRRAEYDAELIRQRRAKREAAGRATAGTSPAGTSHAGVAPSIGGAGTPAPRPAAPEATTPATSAPAQPTQPVPSPSWRRMDRETVERRRDSNRRELIKNELQAAGRRGALGAGAGAFIVLGGALGLTAGVLGAGAVLQGASALPAAAAAFFAGRAGSRAARRNIIATLSQMPYEELLMRYSN